MEDFGAPAKPRIRIRIWAHRNPALHHNAVDVPGVLVGEHLNPIGVGLARGDRNDGTRETKVRQCGGGRRVPTPVLPLIAASRSARRSPCAFSLSKSAKRIFALPGAIGADQYRECLPFTSRSDVKGQRAGLM